MVNRGNLYKNDEELVNNHFLVHYVESTINLFFLK